MRISNLLLSAALLTGSLFGFANQAQAGTGDRLGLGVNFVVDRDDDSSSTVIELNGKKVIKSFGEEERTTLSVRGTVNTATELGLGLSVDHYITDRLQIAGGGMAVKRLDKDDLGTVTGTDNSIIPVVFVEGSYNMSPTTSVFVKATTPFSGSEAKGATLSSGFSFDLW